MVSFSRTLAFFPGRFTQLFYITLARAVLHILGTACILAIISDVLKRILLPYVYST